ncbi:MAG: DUF1588 domain-containing protein [Deltaproteobacteria bacterium]|nr:DUF1588 domain-containing protein [Deltaproteobacteria bacterium]
MHARLHPLRVALAIAAMMLGGCREAAEEAGGGDSSGGETEASTTEASTGEVPTEAPAGPPSMRRLLGYQYRNAIRDVLGATASDAALPPEDLPRSGQRSIGAAELVAGDDTVARYEESAIAVVNALFTDAAAVEVAVGCTPVANDDPACARDYIDRVGRRMFRRPLDDEQRARLLALHDDGVALYDSFYGGPLLVIAAMLQSPSFLYLVEVGEPDPEDDSLRRLDDWELAAKISFFLVGTTPRDELLELAEQGALDDPDVLREVARDLLATAGAADALDQHIIELLQLDDLDGLVKVPAAFPALGDPNEGIGVFSAELSEAARQETLRLVRDLVWERDTDIRELVTADYTFTNPVTAGLYLGTPIDPTADFEQYTRTELPADQQRSGILGHMGLLSLLANATRTSPTRRGKLIREALLCDVIQPPPDDVQLELPPDTDAPTMRDKLMQHQQDPACAGCHVSLDGLGFALEPFDGMGFHRTEDNGFPIDASADLPDLGEFDGPRELGQRLFEEPKLPACLVEKLFRHATGHVETESEQPWLERHVESFVEQGHRLQPLMVELVADPAFSMVREP